MNHQDEPELMIDPKFQDVYPWELTPTGPYIVLTIHYVEGFDPSNVTMKVSDKKDAISVRYPEQPPIVEGKLFGEVKDVVMKINEEEKQITITFSLIKELIPDLICTDMHPETHMLDPLSSFLIFNKYSQSKDDNLKNGCFKYLEFGINAGFLPALLTAADIFARIPQLSSNAVELLITAADKYNAAPAQLQLGLMMMNQPNFKERSFQYIERAAQDKSISIASVILGIMLSPITDMESPKKDAKRAVEIFNEVLEKERNPLALHELAMLYFNGIGVEKDEEKAKTLNEEASKLQNGQIPALEVRDETYVPKPMIDDGCGCGCCHCHDEPDEHDHCGCGCCHEHEEGGKKECDGKGGCGNCHCHDGEKKDCCGKCDGKGGCGGNCHCHDHN